MENCLVTKLKGVVNNDNLRKLGSLSILMKTVASPTASTQRTVVQSNSAKTFVSNIIGNGNFTDSTLQQNLGKTIQDSAFWGSNGDYRIEVADNYQLYNLSSYGVIDLQEVKYRTNLHSFSAYGELINGDVDNLKDLTGLVELNLPASAYGHITDFGKLTSLTTLGFVKSDIDGDIADFVALQRENGRSSGSITMPWLGSSSGYKKLTLNGNPISVAASATNNVNWDAQGNITLS